MLAVRKGFMGSGPECNSWISERLCLVL